MGDRWASFDCYGTLIDWETGIARALGELFVGEDPDRLLGHYHAIEPRVQEGRSLSYREVMRRASGALAAIEGIELTEGGDRALEGSLPDWPPFPEVAGALEEVRRQGWRLAILSNTDPDLLAHSVAAIGVPFDLLVTAAEARSYKPAPGHWRRFRASLEVEPARHVHVAASLFHDIEPCARLGIDCVWINRRSETSDLPRLAELRDLSGLPAALERAGGAERR